MNDGNAGYGRGAYGSGPYGDETEFRVTIVGTNSPVGVRDTLEVEVLVENVGGEGEQDITLEVDER